MSVRRRAERLFIAANKSVWRWIPRRGSRVCLAYGRWLQSIVRGHDERNQNPRTYFLRNRPELDVVARLVTDPVRDRPTKITVLGCSMGAEPYSILWAIRRADPDVAVEMHALDILPEVVDKARSGRWSRAADELDFLEPTEIGELFDDHGDELVVRADLRDAIDFQVGDATNPELAAELGLQDVVVANRFLTHMQPADAERALRTFSELVAPGGHLVCTGVDVDVRTKVMRSLGWRAVEDRIEEIHYGDPSQFDWPWEYWALEPLDTSLTDWRFRYATIFQRPELPAR